MNSDLRTKANGLASAGSQLANWINAVKKATPGSKAHKQALVRLLQAERRYLEARKDYNTALKRAPKTNPAQVAKVQARGGKRFVVATHSGETNERLLDRVNAVKVIKRVNTNPVSPFQKRDALWQAFLNAKTDAEANRVYKQYQRVLKPVQIAKVQTRDGRRLTAATYRGETDRQLLDRVNAVKVINRVNTNPSSPVNEWDDPPEFSDEDLNDAAKQGWLGAGAMRREHGKRAAGPKFFSVTWYSKQRGKRTGFIRPIEAQNRAQAVKQAKAMIENEKGVSNFVAEEVRGNPAKAINVSIGEKIAQLTREGMPHNRAVAIAFSEKRAGKINPRRMLNIYAVTLRGKSLGNIKAATAQDALQKAASHSGAVKRDLRVKLLTELNPSTRAMSERFNGQASGAIVELKASNSAPSDLSRGGKFILLKLVDSSKALRIPGAVVSIDPETERLWIVGDRAPLLNRRAKPGERLNCGEIERIVYETAKRHIGRGKTFEYDHEFVAPRPSLYIDAEGMPLIVGGEYKIRREGIVN